MKKMKMVTPEFGVSRLVDQETGGLVGQVTIAVSASGSGKECWEIKHRDAIGYMIFSDVATGLQLASLLANAFGHTTVEDTLSDTYRCERCGEVDCTEECLAQGDESEYPHFRPIGVAQRGVEAAEGG